MKLRYDLLKKSTSFLFCLLIWGCMDTQGGETDTGTDPVDTHTGTGADSDKNTNRDSGIDTGSGTDLDSNIHSDSDANTDTDINNDSDTISEADTGTDSDSDTDTDTDSAVTCGSITCDLNAYCDSSSGSAECKCNSGYDGNGMICLDVDECLGTPCVENASCVNAPSGSFTCTCVEGYEGDPDIVGCTDVNECLDSPCHAAAESGVYSIDPDGFGPGKVFQVYCEMEGVPIEYLVLPNNGGDYNYSQYTVGGNVTGTDVRTSYNRLRIDPVTLVVTTGDQTHATSTGQALQGATTVTFMPYGSAADCTGSYSTTGQANIDLTGTPFGVVPNSFSTEGWLPGGSAVYSSDSQIVNITGGGHCGWTTVTGTGAPVNDATGQLQLEFIE